MFRNNASNLHKSIGSILTEAPFSNHKIKQEYPVVSVNPNFHNKRCMFDWAIVDLKIVIECMGTQHERRTYWNNDITEDEATATLERIQDLDKQKEVAAIEAGWIYLSFTTKEIMTMTSSRLLKIIKKEQDKKREERREVAIEESSHETIKTKRKSKQKQYRKEAYKQAKERFKKNTMKVKYTVID